MVIDHCNDSNRQIHLERVDIGQTKKGQQRKGVPLAPSVCDHSLLTQAVDSCGLLFSFTFFVLAIGLFKAVANDIGRQPVSNAPFGVSPICLIVSAHLKPLFRH